MKIETGKRELELNNSSEVFKNLNLDERSVYSVMVSCSRGNPEHKAILFTGFNSGQYCRVYNNTYDAPIKMMEIYSIKIIEQLTTM